MADNRELSGGLKAVAYLLGVGLPLLVTGLGAIYSAQYGHIQRELDDLRDIVDANQISIYQCSNKLAATEQRIDSHLIEKEGWIRRIEKNADALTALSKDANARPDPYTGTDAKADRASFMGEIARLEKKIDAVAQCSCYRNGHQ